MLFFDELIKGDIFSYPSNPLKESWLFYCFLICLGFIKYYLQLLPDYFKRLYIFYLDKHFYDI